MAPDKITFISDSEYADIVEYEANIVKQAPEEARTKLDAALEKLELLKSKAYNAGAIRYDKERVQSSIQYDMSDTIAAITETEKMIERLKMQLFAASSSLKYICTAAGFDPFQIKIWDMYYNQGYSMGTIAVFAHTTKSRVQYLLTGFNTQVAFLRAIDILSEYDILEDIK